MKFDGIILDIDGTIWNTTEIVAGAWNKAITKNFPGLNTVTADILKTQFGKTMSEISDNLFPELNNEEKKLLMDQCCVEEHIAIEENNKDITYDGVIECIRALSKTNKLFIVSNCQKGYIELVISKNKIEECIVDFECYGNTDLGKAENIALVIKRNNLQNPVYVGDTQGDFDSCKKISIPFIWASYGFGKIDDQSYFAKINKFSELKNLV